MDWRGGDTYALLPESMDKPPTTSPRQQRLGALLKEAREAIDMRQTQLAGLLGKGQAFVSKYESGASGLDAVDFIEILELTNCDVEHVIAAVKFVPKKTKGKVIRKKKTNSP